MEWIIRAVIDKHTPKICQLADGIRYYPSDLLLPNFIPHQTGDDEIDCRCVVERKD